MTNPGQHLAMKVIRKDLVIEMDGIEKIHNVKDVMLLVEHPFLCNIEYVFQNEFRIYFLMQFIGGGDLNKHFQKVKRFTEEQAKFFAAQVALALAYLHDKNMIYRDLKPEGIMIESDGKMFF